MKLQISRYKKFTKTIRRLTTDNGQRTRNEGHIYWIVSKYIKVYSPLIYILVLLLLSFNFSFAADVKRVALLPFKINSAKDLSFLQDGIFDMLSTRLAKEGQVEVINRSKVDAAMQTDAKSGTVNEAAARSIGTRLKADFVLFGSLTVLGENVSIDSKMVDISGNRPPMTFFDQSQDLGAVITKINLMAADINDKMFGRVTQTQAQTAAKAPPAAQPQPTKKAAIYAHPEKVLKEDGFTSQGQADADSSGIILPAEARETQQQFWKSANFKHLINGVALGDVDNDGKIETVAITPHSLIVYRSESGRFYKVTEISQSKNQFLTCVDIADINANGVAEIFVTSFNAERTTINSFVLEYDGENFAKIIEGSYYIYRVADTPGRGKVLLGQRPRMTQTLSGKIFDMIWQGGEYVPNDEVKTPRDTSLLGLTIGDVLNDGQETAVGYKSNDRIQIIDSAGQRIWDSPDRYGGSMMYYDAPRDDKGQVENKKYFPMRLAVWQNKAQKESEVIAVKNHDLTGHKLAYRKFTKTHIEAFTWNGIHLAPSWKSRQMSGYIPDFTVGDFDNDGQDELVAALVIKAGGIALLTEPKSTIIALPLGPQE
jgi:TolB-like protein